MGNQSNQGADQQNQKPQPDFPTERDSPTEKRDNRPSSEKKLDPATESESNEYLPEGSANAHDLHSDQIVDETLQDTDSKRRTARKTPD
jgi:hypothetical protein